MAIASHGSLTGDTPDLPDHYPRFGWAPVQVTFEIVKDWRSVGRPT